LSLSLDDERKLFRVGINFKEKILTASPIRDKVGEMILSYVRKGKRKVPPLFLSDLIRNKFGCLLVLSQGRPQIEFLQFPLNSHLKLPGTSYWGPLSVSLWVSDALLSVAPVSAPSCWSVELIWMGRRWWCEVFVEKYKGD